MVMQSQERHTLFRQTLLWGLAGMDVIVDQFIHLNAGLGNVVKIFYGLSNSLTATRYLRVQIALIGRSRGGNESVAHVIGESSKDA